MKRTPYWQVHSFRWHTKASKSFAQWYSPIYPWRCLVKNNIPHNFIQSCGAGRSHGTEGNSKDTREPLLSAIWWVYAGDRFEQYTNAKLIITNGPLKVAHLSPDIWPCPVQYVPAWHATHENADVTLPASPNSQQYIQDHHIDIHMVGGGAWTNLQTMTRWRVWKIQYYSGLWCVCRLYVKIIHPSPAVFGSSFRSVFRARRISCITSTCKHQFRLSMFPPSR